MITKSAQNNTISENITAERVADFLLDVGVILLASGAHSGRVTRNCERIADHWGYKMNINPTFTGVFVSVWDKNDKENSVTHYKSVPSHTVHLRILSLVSHLSWKIHYGELTFEEAVAELKNNIRNKNNYNYWLIALAVGFSCSGLTIISGGNIIDALFALIAAFTGSIARVWILKFKFNVFVSFIVASFITSIIASIDLITKWGIAPDVALATAVLYLVPGVPLINSVIDLLEGYYNTSLSRALYAASILTCIALGMALTILLLGITHF